MSERGYLNLHTHSHYSLLEALPKIEDLVVAAKADGQRALALTDNGNMYGAIEFYKECVKAGIKPLLGVDFFVSPRTRHDKEHKTDENPTRLVLIAKDMDGYRSLLRLVTASFIEGFHIDRPRIDHELMARHAHGLIALAPARDSEYMRALESGSQARAEEALRAFKTIYADCFIELSVHPEIEGFNSRMKEAVVLASRLGIEAAASEECHYLAPDDAVARELVDHIRTGRVLNRDVETALPDLSFCTQARAAEIFSEYPEALEVTNRIADMCTLEFTLGKAIFPEYPIPAGSTADSELRTKAENGIAERGLADSPELRARIDHELRIIAQKGYASYFLIVADLLMHAREAGIYTNTRGSAAGSMVSYLCGITTVDPMAFQMPFERFLNPERPSAPDIDMDIADNRRDDLITYARHKYGEDHVVQIGTFGTMLARAAVRDVSRALGYSYGLGDKIAKMIPFPKQGFPVTIVKSLEEVPELKDAYKKDPEAREILDLAQRIEGNARHVGVHAAGVVIAPKPIIEYIPVQLDPKGGKTITQYDMYSIADEYGGIGLLKFDFLGLTNLTVLADSVARVQKRLGVTVELDRITLDDKKVYEMLTRGETLGVFQMASSGMTAYLKELQPTVIHDLNAMVALYRPGPMAFIPEYIERKKNPARVRYLDPRMETILRPTYGILIYQDDVMMIAVELAGYSWGEADKLRKAMGKKIPAEMIAQKDRFVKGVIERGMKPSVAEELWQQIETFAAYGFNKAHAASYGNLAYKTAYMKANFPVDYMAALLTADSGDVEKVAEIIHECARMKLAVLPPSVNESSGTFTVIGDASIRFGLYSIKNFGTGISDAIVAERERGGKFSSIGDFIARVTDKNLNKKSLEALIMAGALDELGERGQLLANIEVLVTHHREHAKVSGAQDSLFGATVTSEASIRLNPAPKATQEQHLGWEKELLGYYTSGHPLDKFRDVLAKQKLDIKNAKLSFPRGIETVIGGYLETTRILLTKKGDKMMFAKISDYSGDIELVVFPKAFEEYGNVFAPGACILVKGKFSDRNGQASFMVDRAKPMG
jgi:DNA polymerase-3 subunit alpha